MRTSGPKLLCGSPTRRGLAPALILLWGLLPAAGCTESDPPAAPCLGTATVCREMTTRCELQGGCALGPRCVEDTTGCTSLATDAACTARPECRWAAGCVGVRDPCEVIGAAQTCDQNAGCLWSSASNVCTGSPTPCDEISEERCDIQSGCYLGGDCYRAADCGTFSVTECPAQDGCVIGEGCVGDVTPCADFATSETCGWQVGCTWSL